MTDFQKFRAAVYFWADTLGLFDWEIYVEEFRFPRARKNEAAAVLLEYRQRLAVVQWNTQNKGSIGAPEELALHEVLHVLVSAVTGLAAHAGSTQDIAVDAEEHAMIKRLMRVLLERKGSNGS